MDTQPQPPEVNRDATASTASDEGNAPALSAPSTPAGTGDHEPAEEIEDFGKAFEQWETGLKPLKEGEVVQGRVIKILDKEVIVDVGYKSEGVIDIDEVRAPDGSLTVKEGDRVEVLLEKTENNDG